MKIITTKLDLLNWVDEHMGQDANDAEVDAVVAAIRHDESSPAWGEDWTEYLYGLDLWALADANTGKAGD